jgi:protein-S-isoprenylcysteine O-methyltransferase Ste14
LVATERGPDIHFPPPAIYIVVFVAGLALEKFLRIAIVGDLRAPLLAVFGTALFGLALFLMLWGVLTFRKHHTSILPFRPTSALVQTGPYRFTRNPMYVGMTTAYVGAALALNAGWPLLLLPVALYLIVRFVIRREEEYLARMFGAEYQVFKQRVRRWL